MRVDELWRDRDEGRGTPRGYVDRRFSGGLAYVTQSDVEHNHCIVDDLGHVRSDDHDHDDRASADNDGADDRGRASHGPHIYRAVDNAGGASLQSDVRRYVHDLNPAAGR